MKSRLSLCAISALACTLTACTGSKTSDHNADVKALQDNEAQWNQDYAAKDAGKLAAHYANDAVVMMPGEPPISGKDAITTQMTEMVSDPALSIKFQASKVDVANSGDLGYTQGSYTLTMTDPNTKKVINDRGSYVTAYKKQPDGSWKAVADIATSELPKTPPPSAKQPQKAAGRGRARHR